MSNENYSETLLSAVTRASNGTAKQVTPTAPPRHFVCKVTGTGAVSAIISIKAIIDRAVSMGHSLVLYCHRLTTGAPGGDTMITQYSEFTQIVDYVAGLRDQDVVDVVSFSRLCRMIAEQELPATPEATA